MLSHYGKLLLVAIGMIANTVLVTASDTTTAFGANTPAPAWRVLGIPDPTAFTSNQAFGECVGCTDKYTILIANVGGRASSKAEPITVTDNLPGGLTTAGTPGGESGGTWQCSAGSSVTCTYSEEVPANGGVAQPLWIPVVVSSGVPPGSTLVNEVTVSGGGGAPVTIASPTSVNPEFPLSLGVSDLGALLAGPDGSADTQAGAHPSSFTLNFDTTSVTNTVDGHLKNPTTGAEDLKDVVVDLPPGLVGDPQAAPRCPLSSLVLNGQGPNNPGGESACPADTSVGTLLFSDGGGYGATSGKIVDSREIFNMVPERGYPAEFGFTFASFPFVLYGSLVGNGAQAHVRVTIPGIPGVGAVPIQGALSTFFGEDTGSGHAVPFFTNPSQCSSAPLSAELHIDSYENPGAYSPDDGAPDFSDPAWKGETTPIPPFTGCEDLPFGPTIEARPTSAATSSPTGLDFHLHIPQSEETELGEADLEDAAVTLPEGLVLNPAAAGGLAACSEAEVGLQNNDPANCPQASKLGTVEVTTPLLEHPLPGSVYLAAQNENPFHSLLALYIVIDDPATGVITKLPGHVELGEEGVSNGLRPGQVRTTFDENPQVPFENLELHLDKRVADGEEPRAPLVTPSACRGYATTSDLTPWSAPFTSDAMPSSEFELDEGCEAPGFSPSFTAGTSDPQAGAFTPFSVTFSRQASEQDLGGIELTTPPGLLGDLKGVAQCPEGQANAGNCGPDSQLGEATATVGAGPDPYTVTGGKVYLTGPYKGGPFGLSVVVPTTAGPFTLIGNAGYGKEVVRSSIKVNPNTAQVTVASDPLPSIIEGVPLQVRTVNVTINREHFMFNPTNCGSLKVTGKITSTDGASKGVESPFAAYNCASLPFNPSFTASTAGKTSKADGASLIVEVSQKPGEANIHKVDLQLPLALPARLTTLQKACTEAQFNANPAGCPEASNIATATATTPVLNTPLTGPAYLVSHGGAAFPDVEFVLQGENRVEVILDGGTDIKKGITYSKFETVPDAPITSFVTDLSEGPHSALAANTVLCGATLTAPTTITAQNGAVKTQDTHIAVTGCAKPALKAKAKAKAGGFVQVTVTTSQPGAVTVSGGSLKTTTKTLAAGTHQLEIALTKSGKTARKHGRRTRIKVTVKNPLGSAHKIVSLKL